MTKIKKYYMIKSEYNGSNTPSMFYVCDILTKCKNPHSNIIFGYSDGHVMYFDFKDNSHISEEAGFTEGGLHIEQRFVIEDTFLYEAKLKSVKEMAVTTI